MCAGGVEVVMCAAGGRGMGVACKRVCMGVRVCGRVYGCTCGACRTAACDVLGFGVNGGEVVCG